jgi:hypothetical protein
MTQCQALTKRGLQCKNNSKPNLNFCTTHKDSVPAIKVSNPVKTLEKYQQDAIILLNISGTDPTKEASAKVYLCDHRLVKRKIREILISIYLGFIDHTNDYCIGGCDCEIGKGCTYMKIAQDYQNILDILEKSKEIDLNDLPYNPILESQIPTDEKPPGYKPHTGLLMDFNQSDDYVALDYHTSFHRHYFIDIQEDITDEIDILIHEH